MIFILIFFVILAALLSSMIVLKTAEIKTGGRSPILGSIAFHLDPIVGKMIDLSNFFSAEVVGDILRFLAAKVGLWTASGLFSLRNFSSKLAAHLYHTSRKVESGDPAASHPSFFIKAILDFKDKMKEDREREKK